MIIIGSDVVRVVGQRYVGIIHDNASFPEQPFVVLRQATYDEWLAGLNPESRGRTFTTSTKAKNGYFYEIATD